MIVTIFMVCIAFCIANFDSQLMKQPINLYSAPFSFQTGSVDDQLKVIPRILDFIADFTLNKDLKTPEIAINYLEALAIPTYKLFEMRELVSKLIKLSLQTHITRFDPLEVEPLMSKPDEIGAIVVGEFYMSLYETLDKLNSKPSDGEITYLMLTLAGHIKVYELIKQTLKPYDIK